MSYFRISSLVIWIFTAYFLNQISALDLESLVGGYPTQEGTFEYQVAILARSNFSIDMNLICSGGIITAKLILTAAQCFFDQFRYFKELSYFIVVNSTDLTTPFGIPVDITYIYVPDFRHPDLFSLFTNDIAIAQTELHLLLLECCHLKSLKIPKYGESFSWIKAVVAGYGDNEITLETKANSNVHVLVNGTTNYTLNHADVIILGDGECYKDFAQIKLPTDKLMCGFMMTDEPEQHWGLCSNDFGAPLVYNNTVIGIASTHTSDCNDTGNGSLYTKVSSFLYFIKNVIGHVHTKSNLAGAIVFPNRPHIIH